MKKGDHRRTPMEIEADRQFAVSEWVKGFTIREIAQMLSQKHENEGNPYDLNFVTVQRDIVATIQEAKKLRDKAGLSDLEDLISKAEFIYNEAIVQNRATPNPGYLGVADKAITQLCKLKGIAPEKIDVTMKYDIEI